MVDVQGLLLLLLVRACFWFALACVVRFLSAFYVCLFFCMCLRLICGCICVCCVCCLSMCVFCTVDNFDMSQLVIHWSPRPLCILACTCHVHVLALPLHGNNSCVSLLCALWMVFRRMVCDDGIHMVADPKMVFPFFAHNKRKHTHATQTKHRDEAQASLIVPSARALPHTFAQQRSLKPPRCSMGTASFFVPTCSIHLPPPHQHVSMHYIFSCIITCVITCPSIVLPYIDLSRSPLHWILSHHSESMQYDRQS